MSPQTLFLTAEAAVVDRIDPRGDLRRVGLVTRAGERWRAPVAASADGQGEIWTPRSPTVELRVCWMRQRLYRRERLPRLPGFSGHEIKHVSLDNAALVREWLEG